MQAQQERMQEMVKYQNKYKQQLENQTREHQKQMDERDRIIQQLLQRQRQNVEATAPTKESTRLHRDQPQPRFQLRTKHQEPGTKNFATKTKNPTTKKLSLSD